MSLTDLVLFLGVLFSCIGTVLIFVHFILTHM